MAEPRKILLGEDELPSAWFNIVPSMPTKPDPYLHPQTRQPVGPDDLAPLFPMALIGQEVSTDEWIDIPGPVLDVYKLWRPTPLIRALDLERALGTPARIYYKYEGGSPAGSHKPNTAVPQAFYNKAEGITRISTETGAGQWGSAMAFACARFDLECKVYMVRASYDGKPYRRSHHGDLGGQRHPLAVPGDRRRPGRPRPGPRLARVARASPSPRPSRTPPPARTPTTRWAACSTTCCSTRRSSAWS